MKITQTNPLTFEDEVFEIDDYQHKLAVDIKEALEKHIETPVFALEESNITYPINVTQIIVQDNKLNIGYMRERKLGGKVSKYKITVEKMNSDV
jgi:hypothetical protein